MEGFDDPGVFFSDNFGVEENESRDQINLQAVKKKFKEFIRQFHTGNFNYKYRYFKHSSPFYIYILFGYDTSCRFLYYYYLFFTIVCHCFRDSLKRNYNLGQYWVEINIEDLSSFDEILAEKLYKKPTEHLPILEEAAKEVKGTNPSLCCYCFYDEFLDFMR